MVHGVRQSMCSVCLDDKRFRCGERGNQRIELCWARECDGSGIVDEAGNVYPVECGGKVERSKNRALVRRE